MFWSSVAGMLVGLFALPAKTLFDAVRFTVTTWGVNLSAIIATPIISIYKIWISNESFPVKLVAFLAVIPLTLVITLVLGIISVATTAEVLLFTPFLILYDIYRGIKASIMEGWQGFTREWGVSTYFDSQSENRNVNLFDTPTPGVIDETLHENVEELSPAELEKALTIIATNNPPVGTKAAKELTALRHAYERYTKIAPVLQPKLNKIKEILAQHVEPGVQKDYASFVENDLCSVDDILEPVLFVKEYEYEPGSWKAVPANTYITDRKFIGDCIEKLKINPHNRDDVHTPPAEQRGEGKGKPVRYRLYPLSTAYCSAPFLDEDAKIIRAASASANLKVANNPEPSSPVEVARSRPIATTVSVANTPQTIFAHQDRGAEEAPAMEARAEI